MKQEDYSPKQTAAMKARVRRMRAQYRRRTTVAAVIFFILGAVAGVFAHRWYVDRTPDISGVLQVATPEPAGATLTLAPQVTPEAWAMPDDESSDEDDDIFPESGNDSGDRGAAQDAFPEVNSQKLTEDEDSDKAQEDEGSGLLLAPGEKLEPQPEDGSEDAEPQPEAGSEGGEPQPEAGSEDAPEAGDVHLDGGNDQAEGVALQPDASAKLDDVAQSTGSEGANAQNTEAGSAEAEKGEAQSAASTDTGYGPQVVAIVPYGESFTYTTEINAEGNARVEATNEPYETVCFTQTMKGYMRPADYADKYAKLYKLQGDEAGAGFELTLIDYTGNTPIIPQNVVDVSLRSESGNTVEHGYQMMDAEIDGRYGISLSTNTPTMLYKRFAYPIEGEEMKYLVITTYKNGQTQMILFELESNEPEPDPEVIYPVLQRGLANDDVLNLQNRLAELGYLSVTPDGSFGQKTEDAIKAAQAAFGMEQNGIADNAFQQKLYEGAAPSAGEGEGFVTLSEGSTGDAVVLLQKRLAELGYYSGRADGGYGPKMVAAVKAAQADFGMEQNGIATSEFQKRAFGDDSADASGDADDSGNGTGYTVLQNGSKGDDVTRLQLILREQGYYDGKADGGYGPKMVAAVKAAQADFGMEQTGIADIPFQQRVYGTVIAPTEAPEEAADGNTEG